MRAKADMEILKLIHTQPWSQTYRLITGVLHHSWELGYEQWGEVKESWIEVDPGTHLPQHSFLKKNTYWITSATCGQHSPNSLDCSMKCGASPSTETVNARHLFWVGGSFVPPRTQYRTFVFKEVDLDISPNVKNVWCVHQRYGSPQLSQRDQTVSSQWLEIKTKPTFRWNCVGGIPQSREKHLFFFFLFNNSCAKWRML